MPDGKDILRTLIKLLAAQEQIKITYTLRDNEGKEERYETISSPN